MEDRPSGTEYKYLHLPVASLDSQVAQPTSNNWYSAPISLQNKMQLSTILAFTVVFLTSQIMANPMNLRRRDVCCESGSGYKDICCAEYVGCSTFVYDIFSDDEQCLAIGQTGNSCEGKYAFFFVSYKSSSFDVANSMVASAPADNFVQSMDIQVRVSIVDLMHVRCRLGYSI